MDIIYTEFSNLRQFLSCNIVHEMEIIWLWWVFVFSLQQLYIKQHNVDCKGFSSKQFRVTSEVIQGSILCLFFKIYFNDICNNLTVRNLLHSDDLTVVDDVTDCLTILSKVHNWYSLNHPLLNIAKCNVFIYT